jgi:hypothetical protein
MTCCTADKRSLSFLKSGHVYYAIQLTHDCGEDIPAVDGVA